MSNSPTRFSWSIFQLTKFDWNRRKDLWVLTLLSVPIQQKQSFKKTSKKDLNEITLRKRTQPSNSFKDSLLHICSFEFSFLVWKLVTQGIFMETNQNWKFFILKVHGNLKQYNSKYNNATPLALTLVLDSLYHPSP